MKAFEPRLVGFCCNHAAYIGADAAGINRIQYPPHIRMIRMMCSGALDPIYILEAFKKAADGILIVACHPGACHYQSGNYAAERRIALLKVMLPQLGIDPRRLKLEWISVAEGPRFAQAVTDFVEEIRELGPALVWRY